MSNNIYISGSGKVTGGDYNNINISGRGKVLLIEGDNIEIENTRAKVVRGKNIIVGKNCTIERIEYSGEFKVDEESLVEEKILI